MISTQEASNLFHKIKSRFEPLSRLPKEDAVSELVALGLELKPYTKEFHKAAIRRMWELYGWLYNQPVSYTWLNKPSNSWTENQIDLAKKIAAYYKRHGWIATAKKFKINPTNKKAQKILSEKFGRDRSKPVSGKPPGARVRVPANEKNLKGLSRTTCWRAKKRGWVTILKKQTNEISN